MTSKTSVDLDFEKREIVILGTEYAGEMKKGIFTVMNYLMPLKGSCLCTALQMWAMMVMYPYSLAFRVQENNIECWILRET